MRLALAGGPRDARAGVPPWRAASPGRWPRAARHAARPGAPQPAVHRAAGARRRRPPAGGPRRRRAVDRRRAARPCGAPAAARPGGADPRHRRARRAGRGAATGRLPVVAEPASALWAPRCAPGRGWSGARRTLRPAQVVVAGRPTLHRPVQRLLADPDVAVYAVADPEGGRWTDVAGTVRAVGAVPPLRPPPGWPARWRDADAAAAEALDARARRPEAPGGLRLARALVAALPDGAQLVLGSSNPVRDVSLAAVPRPRRHRAGQPRRRRHRRHGLDRGRRRAGPRRPGATRCSAT